MPPAPKREKSPSGTGAATATAKAKAKAKRKTPVPKGRLYWSISEVADLTGVKPHVLRYWETEFPSFKPKKNSAGNRHYRERDVEMALAIKHLLYKEKYTIKGAKKRLAETRKTKELIDQLEIPFGHANQRQLLKEIREDLEALFLELDGK